MDYNILKKMKTGARLYTNLQRTKTQLQPPMMDELLARRRPVRCQGRGLTHARSKVSSSSIDMETIMVPGPKALRLPECRLSFASPEQDHRNKACFALAFTDLVATVARLESNSLIVASLKGSSGIQGPSVSVYRRGNKGEADEPRHGLSRNVQDQKSEISVVECKALRLSASVIMYVADQAS